MSEHQNDELNLADSTPVPETPPIVYATPVQRAWAWVGVAYMVISVFLVTYFLAHGSFLSGIGNLMVVPALSGFGVAIILRQKAGTCRGGLPMCIFIALLSFGLAVYNLMAGVPALLAVL